MLLIKRIAVLLLIVFAAVSTISGCNAEKIRERSVKARLESGDYVQNEPIFTLSKDAGSGLYLLGRNEDGSSKMKENEEFKEFLLIGGQVKSDEDLEIIELLMRIIIYVDVGINTLNSPPCFITVFDDLQTQGSGSIAAIEKIIDDSYPDIANSPFILTDELTSEELWKVLEKDILNSTEFENIDIVIMLIDKDGGVRAINRGKPTREAARYVIQYYSNNEFFGPKITDSDVDLYWWIVEGVEERMQLAKEIEDLKAELREYDE